MGRFFEDFTPGDVYRHARGKTATEMDGVLLTNLVMNTAQAHFNADARRDSATGKVLVFGGVTIAMVIGLSTQDTAENAVAELGLDNIRLRAPVSHGDTLYAYTEVVSTSDSTPAAGEVTFRHWGVNQDGVVVFTGERRVLVAKAAA
jgi:itaconyl-CoA hydratase